MVVAVKFHGVSFVSKPKKTVVNVKPALQGYRVYLYCTSIQDDLNLESEFSQFQFKFT